MAKCELVSLIRFRIGFGIAAYRETRRPGSDSWTELEVIARCDAANLFELPDEVIDVVIPALFGSH